MYASYGLVKLELHVKTLDMAGFTLAILGKLVKGDNSYQVKKNGDTYRKK